MRSIQDISGFSGYQIQALDQLFGHVDTFLFEERNWAIRYLVCDMRNWWPGKHFLLAPQWIAWVSWSEARVYVDLDREAIQRAPEYRPTEELTREYEQKLFAHYNREPYWRPDAASQSSRGGGTDQRSDADADLPGQTALPHQMRASNR